MKNLLVPAIYIATDKIKTKAENSRLERFLRKIDSKNIIEVPSERIYQDLREKGFYEREQKTGEVKEKNPIIIFSGFDWQDPINNPLKDRKFGSYEQGKFTFADYRDKKQLLKEKGVYCNSGFEIHTAFGCFNSCTYCHIGNTYTIMLDIEDFIDNVEILMKNNPQQKLFKYDNQCDVPDLEPEYGAINKMVEFFSNTDRHLMLYTKSNNLDYLPGPEVHKGKTIVCWTLSCEDVIDNHEIGASSLEQRLEAVRKCKEKEYRIRYRFSPIIPVRGWREKNSEMISKALAVTQPEVICLESLCHMSKQQYRELFRNVEISPKLKVSEYELFSARKRKEIYEFFIKEISKHDAYVKIALCLETAKVWKGLRKWLEDKPENFFCCCGQNCV